MKINICSTVAALIFLASCYGPQQTRTAPASGNSQYNEAAAATAGIVPGTLSSTNSNSASTNPHLGSATNSPLSAYPNAGLGTSPYTPPPGAVPEALPTTQTAVSNPIVVAGTNGTPNGTNTTVRSNYANNTASIDDSIRVASKNSFNNTIATSPVNTGTTINTAGAVRSGTTTPVVTRTTTNNNTKAVPPKTISNSKKTTKRTTTIAPANKKKAVVPAKKIDTNKQQ